MSAGKQTVEWISAQSVIEPVTNERRGWSNWPTIQRRAAVRPQDYPCHRVGILRINRRGNQYGYVWSSEEGSGMVRVLI
jgi:hypothetical protein